MKRIKNQIIIVFSLLMLCGCTAYYPQLVHIPLIEGQGDLKIDWTNFLALGGLDEEDGARHGLVGGTLTATYGATDWLAVQGYMGFDILGRAHLQGALGIFNKFDNKTVIELYGGYGIGRSGWKDDKSGNYVDGSYQLTFAQFNIGQNGIGSPNLDYGFGLKSGYIFGTHKAEKQNDGWVVEPSAFLRFGGEKIKISIQVNYLWTKTVSENYYYPLGIGFGLHLNLNTKGKAKNEM
ncbi:MAG: hypothetical protein LBH22_00210 [Bacteroidales bacterium]|jgi:hypothetical protein|nr:hypothetical protein [Bacteroidales bacterium]